jgi:hypothetical protein
MLKRIFHIIIWVIVFFDGIIRLLELGPVMLRIVVPTLILSLLFMSYLNGIKRIPHLLLMLFLFVTIIVSGFINGIDALNIAYFITYIIFPLLYLVIIVSENNYKTLDTIKYTIIILYALQIPAVIIKYIMVGQTEYYVGTIHLSEGSLNAIIPMIAISYLFSKYLYTNNKQLLIYILLFVLFGLIGEKRALIFFLPFIIILLYAYYMILKKVNIYKGVGMALSACVLTFVIIYIIVRLNPTLTPEGKAGGSFDLKYVLEYTNNYERSGKTFEEMRRIDGIKYFIKYLYQSDPLTFLFGEGAGKILLLNDHIEDRPMMAHYGVRYGGRMGIIWLYLQIGIVGTLLFIFILIRMIYCVIKVNKNNYHSLAFLGIWTTVIIDILIYSNSSIRFFAVYGTLCFYYGIIYLDSIGKYRFNIRKHLILYAKLLDSK